MANYPADWRYSEEHEWVQVVASEGADEQDVAVIGITDFAQAELGDVVFVELPELGESFSANDEIGTIESVKAVGEIYTPVSGEVVEINSSLEDKPEQVNEDPHGDGWLLRLKMSDADELGSLMEAAAYEEFVESEE